MATRIEASTSNPYFSEATGVGIPLTLSNVSGDSVSVSAITAIAYTFTDENGNAINSKEDISLDAANPVTVPLNKTDMTCSASETTQYVTRLLTVTWTYNDSVLGDGTQKVEEFSLLIENYKNK